MLERAAARFMVKNLMAQRADTQHAIQDDFLRD
jgi:hypothetical protein